MNLLVGTDDFDDKDSYNAAVLLTDNGKEPQAYHKIHLVPFGEYIPLRHSFPLFAWFAGEMVPGDFRAGTEPTLLETENPPLKIAPLICFEDTIGDLTRQFVLRGGQVLVNVTNDGWFQKTEGAEQHLANAIFRAVETRRPLVRAANTGVTCFVDRCGQVKQDLPPFTESTLCGRINIPENQPVTFYVKYGDYIPITSLSIICVELIFLINRFLSSSKPKRLD